MQMSFQCKKEGEEVYNYPTVKYQPQTICYGNRSVEDGYEWMRNAEDPDTIAFTDSQNEFTDRYFEEYGDIFNRYLKEQCEMANVQMFREIVRTRNGIAAMRMYEDGVTDTVLLNEDFSVKEVVTNEAFMDSLHVHGISVNPVNTDVCILLSLRDKAERMCGLVYDIRRRELIGELKDTFSVEWSSCGTYVYYSKAEPREDGTLKNTLRRYDIHTRKEEILYTYGGHAAYGMVYPMDQGGVVVSFAVDYHAGAVVIWENGHITEVPYDGNARYYIGTKDGMHLFVTDKDAAMGKIVAVKKGEDFQTAVTYIDETNEKISAAYVNKDRIICVYEEAGAQSLCIYDKDKNRKNINLPCKYGAIQLEVQESKAEKPLFSYESFSVPTCVMELDVENACAKVLYYSEPPCEDVCEEKTEYISRDGVRLIAYIVHKKNIEKNGNNKTLFYGYGGYNATNYVSYKACDMSIVKWLEEDGVYVHCIIRGGGEFGETWHQGGWKGNKKNVFNDFCDIVEGVIADHWTNPSKVAICGLSNGGLLMTALITRRPDLFGCVIASVPQTDLLGFVNDDRGSMYITEYGDPRDEKMFEYMRSYSPYHNVKKDVHYPGIYIQAGAMDNNVPAYHAKKFTAKMQGIQGERPVLLRVLPYGSHDRGTGKYYCKTIAEMRTFIEIELN